MRDTEQIQGEYWFLLVPGFSLLAMSAAIDVLRAANLEAGTEAYRWRLVADAQANVSSSSGLSLAVEPLRATKYQSCFNSPNKITVVIVGGSTLETKVSDVTRRWLQDHAAQGVPLGSLSDGAFIAAECGLFNGYRSTTHWKNLELYRDRFPNLDTRASILEIDKHRFSCAGGSASLDLFLQFVLQDLGSSIVARIADNYFHDRLRDSSINQHVADAYRYAVKSRALAEALRIMSQQLETPLQLSDIAAQAGTTHRSLDRLFEKHMQTTPGKYYRRLRLNRAANLLLQTGFSVSEIALASGFGSASHLGMYFKKEYEMSPKAFRQQGTVF